MHDIGLQLCDQLARLADVQERPGDRAQPVLATHVIDLNLRADAPVVGRRLTVMETQHRDTVDVVLRRQRRDKRTGHRLDAAMDHARLQRIRSDHQDLEAHADSSLPCSVLVRAFA